MSEQHTTSDEQGGDSPPSLEPSSDSDSGTGGFSNTSGEPSSSTGEKHNFTSPDSSDCAEPSSTSTWAHRNGNVRGQSSATSSTSSGVRSSVNTRQTLCTPLQKKSVGPSSSSGAVSSDQRAPSGAALSVVGIPPQISLEEFERFVLAHAGRSNIVECSMKRVQGATEGQVVFDSMHAAATAAGRLHDATLGGSRLGVSVSSHPGSGAASASQQDQVTYWCEACEIEVRGPGPLQQIKQTHENGTRHAKCLRMGPPSKRMEGRPRGEELHRALRAGALPAANAQEAVIAFPQDVAIQRSRRGHAGSDGECICVLATRRRFTLSCWKNALQHLLHIRGICPDHYFDQQCAGEGTCKLHHDIHKAPRAETRQVHRRSQHPHRELPIQSTPVHTGSHPTIPTVKGAPATVSKSPSPPQQGNVILAQIAPQAQSVPPATVPSAVINHMSAASSVGPGMQPFSIPQATAPAAPFYCSASQVPQPGHASGFSSHPIQVARQPTPVNYCPCIVVGQHPVVRV